MEHKHHFRTKALEDVDKYFYDNGFWYDKFNGLDECIEHLKKTPTIFISDYFNFDLDRNSRGAHICNILFGNDGALNTEFDFIEHGLFGSYSFEYVEDSSTSIYGGTICVYKKHTSRETWTICKASDLLPAGPSNENKKDILNNIVKKYFH